MIGMKKMSLAVRELTEEDIPPLIEYWVNATPDFLAGMGADINNIPPREEWEKMLREQISQPYREKKSYCIIWLLDDEPIGHSNVNKIRFGEEAYMHLHLWNNDTRQQGLGTQFVKLTIPLFFEMLKLRQLFCEPYALNPAPNRILEKTGFRFVKEYTTTPGWLNFEQPVKLWKLSREDFKT